MLFFSPGNHTETTLGVGMMSGTIQDVESLGAQCGCIMVSRRKTLSSVPIWRLPLDEARSSLGLHFLLEYMVWTRRSGLVEGGEYRMLQHRWRDHWSLVLCLLALHKNTFIRTCVVQEHGRRCHEPFGGYILNLHTNNTNISYRYIHVVNFFHFIRKELIDFYTQHQNLAEKKSLETQRNK